MPNPLKLLVNPAVQARFLRLRVVLAGIARDFWKDGSRPPVAAPQQTVSAGKRAESVLSPSSQNAAGKKLWSGDRIDVLEKMWGEGEALPGGQAYADTLIKPLGLNKDMSVLDLNAKLGGLGRRIAVEFGSYVTGMETDAALVSRGMILSMAIGKVKQASLETYDPSMFKPSRKYDAIFVRELFYKLLDKDRFIKAVDESLKKEGGQIVFTDFLMDPAAKQNPVVADWLAKEGDVELLSPLDVIKKWKGLGLDLRVAEDQTDFYRGEILKGLANLLEFLSAQTPDKDTKWLFLKEIDFWTRRLVALKHGLKYYRFYGIKY